MTEVWYVVGLCAASLAVLLVGHWYVRHELRTRTEPPPAAVLWGGYALVAVVVVLGCARTSWVVLDSDDGTDQATALPAHSAVTR
ncbi:hypothetical protein [Nocardioides sp. KR10-350]|uniref:hypothetical protein n=1 Tax=Nocardioides cheoyonin TaxID=3156615 RepID=UPI0032B3C95B